MRVYLDQNKWIDLLRAAAGEPRLSKHREAHDTLLTAALDGSMSFPLSSVHLDETVRIRDAVRRRDLALTMTRFSRRHAIAPIGALLDREIDEAVHRLWDCPTSARAPEPFGVGMAFACGWADADVCAGVPCSSDLDSALLDFYVLAGGNPTAELVAATAQRHHTAVNCSAAESKMREQLHAARYKNKFGRDRVFVTLANQLIEPRLIAAMIGNGIELSQIKALLPDDYAALLTSIPSLCAVASLRMSKLSNPQHPWNAHDRNDINALSVAAVYCDVVVAEKDWTAHMRDAGFEKRYKVRLLTDIHELIPLIA